MERRNALTHHCAWCAKVRIGMVWDRNRRRQPAPLSHGICPRCARVNFPEAYRNRPLRLAISGKRWCPI
jgi:hypothetical protein